MTALGGRVLDLEELVSRVECVQVWLDCSCFKRLVDSLPKGATIHDTLELMLQEAVRKVQSTGWLSSSFTLEVIVWKGFGADLFTPAPPDSDATWQPKQLWKVRN